MTLSDERSVSIACPRCGGTVKAGSSVWACAGCDASFPLRNGWIDFEPSPSDRGGFAQRFVQSPAVTAIYEDLLRPALTRLGSGIGYAHEHAFLQRHLSPVDGPVLDVGSGTGRYADWLASRFGASRVIAVDISAAMLDRAVQDARRRGYADVLFLRAPVVALPIRPGSLGGVTCHGALHLAADPEGAAKALARAMRPRAPLVCVATLGSGRWLQGSARQAIRGASSMTFFDGDRLLETFKRHGLTVTATHRDRTVMMIAAQNSGDGCQYEARP
jgi:SAM-dependent methyltransferase